MSGKAIRLVQATKAFKGSTVYVWATIKSDFVPCVVQERAPIDPAIRGTRWLVSHCGSGLMLIRWDWEQCRWTFA